VLLLAAYWLAGAGLHVRPPGYHVDLFVKWCAVWLIILAAAFLAMGIAKGRKTPRSQTPGFGTALWLVGMALSFTVSIFSYVWSNTLTPARPLQVPPLVSPKVFAQDYIRLMRDPGSSLGSGFRDR
jgi:hypothetical protein